MSEPSSMPSSPRRRTTARALPVQDATPQRLGDLLIYRTPSGKVVTRPWNELPRQTRAELCSHWRAQQVITFHRNLAEARGQ